MLLQEMNQLGGSFRANRTLDQAALDRELDRQLRQQVVDEQVSERREATQARQQHYQAQQTAADAAAKARQDQADAVNKRLEMQDKQNTLKELIQLNASGALQNLDGVNDWLSNDDHFGQTGIQLKEPPQAPPSHVGQNATAAGIEYLNGLYTKRDQAADKATKDRLSKQIQVMESSLDPSAFETVTQEQLDDMGKVVGRTISKRPRSTGTGLGDQFKQWMSQQGLGAPGSPAAAAAPQAPTPAPNPFAVPPGVQP